MRMDFAWSTIKETSKDSEDHIIQDAFSRATNDEGTKRRLIQFVSDIYHIMAANLYHNIRLCMEGLHSSAVSSPKLVKELEAFMA